MRFSKRFLGISAVAALIVGMASTDRAYAGTGSGTQIEFVENSETTNAYRTIAIWRTYVATLILSAL